MAGLSSDEAGHRLQELGPNSMPDASVHPIRRALGKFWAPVPWMLGDRHRRRARSPRLCRGCGHRGPPDIQRRPQLSSAEPRPGHAGGPEVAACADGVRPSRRRLEDCPRSRVGGRRHRQAVARRGGRRRRPPLGGFSPDRSVHAHRRIGADRRRPGPSDVCRGARAARRGGCGGHRHGHPDQIWTHRRAGPHRSRHQHPAKGGLPGRPQSRHLQQWGHRACWRPTPCSTRCRCGRWSRLLLTAVLSSIPVALPATFTLAAAIGAKALAKLGVLPTRLSAIDEAATMDVLCVDKTGTLTQNALTVTAVRVLDGSNEARVLGLAALASSDGGQDSVDAAIRSAASRQKRRRSAEADPVRPVRSGQQEVRGRGDRARMAFDGESSKEPSASFRASRLPIQMRRALPASWKRRDTASWLSRRGPKRRCVSPASSRSAILRAPIRPA